MNICQNPIYLAFYATAFVGGMFFLAKFFVEVLKNLFGENSIKNKTILTLEDDLVDQYVKKNYPGWRWEWTTIDEKGDPQILLKKGDDNNLLDWDLLKQSEIIKK